MGSRCAGHFGLIAWSNAIHSSILSPHLGAADHIRCGKARRPLENRMTARFRLLTVTISAIAVLVAYGVGPMMKRPLEVDSHALAVDCSSTRMLSAMRDLLQPESDVSESGGIYLGPIDPDDDDALITYAALAQFCPALADDSSFDDWPAFAEVLVLVASHFITEAHLEPGRYALAEPTDASGEDEGVTVSPEHLALLRRMNTRVLDYTVMLMDSKRPYGDMSHFYIDMARALGEPVPLNENGYAAFMPEVIARYDELHSQMPRVVRVFWRHATFVSLAD